jgi:scyllo-inositol 2-dehydrogenase (NADP+)
VKVIIVGLGIQGRKRQVVAGTDVVATVDPIHPDATYKRIEEVPHEDFDSALLCIPDESKISIIDYLLTNQKHVLVEKPLFATNPQDLLRLKLLSEQTRKVCYTAYNHRFEPHFIRMKGLIDSGILGKIYGVKLFYGNGTARLVRDSAWRDKGAGVLPDLGSHLLDTVNYWFGQYFDGFNIHSANRFENQSFDHITFGSNDGILLQFELSLLSWKNHFYADVFAEKGSAHISSLCKWGPSTFTVRDRKLPSGQPNEESVTLAQSDPTWAMEYEHFKRLTASSINNLENDIWINNTLQKLAASLPQ